MQGCSGGARRARDAEVPSVRRPPQQAEAKSGSGPAAAAVHTVKQHSSLENHHQSSYKAVWWPSGATRCDPRTPPAR